MPFAKVMDALVARFFESDPSWAVRHHLDSFRAFLDVDLPDTVRTFNDGRLTSEFQNEAGETVHRVTVLVGGREGSVRLLPPELTPAECRTRMASYSGDLRADVHVAFEYLKDRPRTVDRVFRNVRIGRMPVMLRSAACALEGASPHALASAGESVGEAGGYFISGGREKVVVTQEYIRNNTLSVRAGARPGELLGLIKCTSMAGEARLYPKRTDLAVDAGGRVRLRLVRFNDAYIPLHTVFRALGVETDRDILDVVSFGDAPSETGPGRADADAPAESGPWTWVREWLRPSLAVAQEGQYTQQAALDALAATMSFRSVAEALKVLVEDLFPNQGESFRAKAAFLGHLVRRLAAVHTGRAAITDRDAYEFKRFNTAGGLLAEQFRNAYDAFRLNALRVLRDEYDYGAMQASGRLEDLVRDDNLARVMQPAIIEEYMARYMRGVVVKEGEVSDAGGGAEGVVQELSRTNYFSTLSQLRRVNTPLDESLKIRSPRALHQQQFGFVCPFETPDGGHIGLLKNLSMSASITPGSDPEEVVASLRRAGLVALDAILPRAMATTTVVFLNGQMLGAIADPADACERLRLERRAGLLDPFVSVRWNLRASEIDVQCDRGRIVRPLVVNPLPGGALASSERAIAAAAKRVAPHATWAQLVAGAAGRRAQARGEARQASEKRRGVVEHLDVDEVITNALVAVRPEDATAQHTHVEVHPALALSAISGYLPFVGHNQAARNLYACGHAKQAIGVYASNFRHRVDAVAYVAWGAQMPLVTSRFARAHGAAVPLLASGQNLVVAIAPGLGFNQEDSMVLNLASVQRGALRVDVYHGVTAVEENGRTFANPARMREQGAYVAGLKRAYYGALDDEGLPKVGTVVGKDDRWALLGRVREGRDDSVISDADHYGVVDLVNVSGEPGARKVRARLRQTRAPSLGDKLCSRFAQKGVVGLVVEPWKLPRTAAGVVPDVFINPHAIPSRMTIGHLLDTLLGKACAGEGVFGDGTAFGETDVGAVGDALARRGFARAGDETMYDSATGAQLQVPVFVGVTQICRMKLMSEDKLNARAKGPKVRRTMQPAAGRAAGGGLRVGEMERDVFLAHGASAMLRESFMDRSDRYACTVCRACGGRPNGDVCGACGSDDVAVVEMPYTFNLLRHELDAIGVSHRLLTTAEASVEPPAPPAPSDA